MKIFTRLNKPAFFAALVLSSSLAGAKSVDTSDTFYTFYETLMSWTTGGLGVGLAIAMLLMGGAIGVAKNSPMPALTGIAGAAFLHWGPEIIKQIMMGGALV